MKWEKIKPVLAYIYLVLIFLVAFAIFLFATSSG